MLECVSLRPMNPIPHVLLTRLYVRGRCAWGKSATEGGRFVTTRTCAPRRPASSTATGSTTTSRLMMTRPMCTGVTCTRLIPAWTRWLTKSTGKDAGGFFYKGEDTGDCYRDKALSEAEVTAGVVLLVNVFFSVVVKHLKSVCEIGQQIVEQIVELMLQQIVLQIVQKLSCLTILTSHFM